MPDPGCCCLTSLQCSSQGPAAPCLTSGVPQPCGCPGTAPLCPSAGPRQGEGVVAEAAGPRQSSIRSTSPEARDWLRLYVTEEERQHEGLFFFFFSLILIPLQSLSKNNPISLPQECSASEPWLPRPLCISLAAAEQSHYRCHSAALAKSTRGEGSAAASFWVRRGRDGWDAPGFPRPGISRGCVGQGGLSIPLPPWGAGIRERCSSWAIPAALALAR